VKGCSHNSVFKIKGVQESGVTGVQTTPLLPQTPNCPRILFKFLYLIIYKEYRREEEGVQTILPHPLGGGRVSSTLLSEASLLHFLHSFFIKRGHTSPLWRKKV